MHIMETRVPVELGGEKRVMIFNANAFAAYEEATGKFFLDVAASLFDAMKPLLEAKKLREVRRILAVNSGVPDTENTAMAFELLRKVSIKDLRALLWASLHEYNADGDPVWPLTLNEVGRMMSIIDIPRIFTAFLNGQSANSPSVAEVGESPASSEIKKAVNGAPLNAADGGGERSTELPQAAFDFVMPI